MARKHVVRVYREGDLAPIDDECRRVDYGEHYITVVGTDSSKTSVPWRVITRVVEGDVDG